MTTLAIVRSSKVPRPRVPTKAMGGAGLQAFYRRVTANTCRELGFRQSSFHHSARVLRSQPYNAFRLQPLYRHAVFPLGFRFEVGRLTQKFPPNFSRFSWVPYAALRGAQTPPWYTTERSETKRAGGRQPHPVSAMSNVSQQGYILRPPAHHAPARRSPWQSDGDDGESISPL